MICGKFHTGSGLGNQLHRMVMVRCLAMDKDFDWGMDCIGDFKGFSLFRNMYFGSPVEGIEDFYLEPPKVNEFGTDVRDYDWKGINAIKDNTFVDGEFQGYKYYEHHINNIDRWLAVEPLEMSDRLCIINFRGGEYQYFPELFLTIDYWNTAIETMLKVRPDMHFKVVTDDVDLARIFFPKNEIEHDIEKDWRSIRYAKYLILSNSSFAILPAWLNEDCKKTIAPWGWARHNIGYWALEQNKMPGWDYQRLNGTYETFS